MTHRRSRVPTVVALLVIFGIINVVTFGFGVPPVLVLAVAVACCLAGIVIGAVAAAETATARFEDLKTQISRIEDAANHREQ